MAIGCLFIPLLADKFGRWKVFITTMAIQLTLYPVLIFSNKLGVLYTVIFLFGLGGSGRGIMAFILLNELSHKKY
jgi:MFS family permease